MSTTMRAVRVSQFGGPEVLKVELVPLPTPADTQVVVKMEAAGVNPVETYIRSGLYANPPPLPYTPGHDGAGIIYALGKGVTKVHEGDRVYISKSITGTYAEYSLCDQRDVHILPSKYTFEQGAGISIPYRTAYRALFQKGKALAGQTVLVHGGSGGVGLAAIQLARNAGLKVIGTAGTSEGMTLMLHHGASHVFNHREKDYIDKILSTVQPQGIDLIIEMLANVNLPADLKLVGHGGTIVIVGSRGPVEINPRDLMSKESLVVGLLAGKAEDVAAAYEGLDSLLAQGAISPVVGLVMPLDQVEKAHHEVIAHQGGSQGKIILKI